jgi:hypothetical protein
MEKKKKMKKKFSSRGLFQDIPNFEKYGVKNTEKAWLEEWELKAKKIKKEEMESD